MKILVVDDDLITGAMLKKILGESGYNVTHVTDGSKALEAMKSEFYRIILTDWVMPEMDGPTFCRIIRQMNLPQYIYLILLTSKSSKEDAVAGLESGADDYMVKPFDRNELLARIRAGSRLVELEDTRRDTQLKLARSEKVAAVANLSAGIAHEINNPIGFLNSNLNTLRGYADEIKTMLTCYREMAQMMSSSVSQQKMNANLPAVLKKTIQMEQQYDMAFVLQDMDELIEDCSEGIYRIKSIVHEMRYFAHPEKQVMEPCNFTAMLERVMTSLKPRIPDGIDIRYELNQLPEIECNVSHIIQAFTNIIQNAIEAVGNEGIITISGQFSNNALEIVVADNGRGIHPKHLPMVFDPFFTTKEVGQGVGLGLTTALNIIRMHNGSISCTSEPSKGARFTVKMPISENISPQHISAAGQSD